MSELDLSQLPPLVPITPWVAYDPAVGATLVVTRRGRGKFRATASQDGNTLTEWVQPRRRRGSAALTVDDALNEVRRIVISSIAKNLHELAWALNPARGWRHLGAPKHYGTTRCGVTPAYPHRLDMGVAEDATCVDCISDLWRIISVAPFLTPAERQ